MDTNLNAKHKLLRMQIFLLIIVFFFFEEIYEESNLDNAHTYILISVARLVKGYVLTGRRSASDCISLYILDH